MEKKYRISYKMDAWMRAWLASKGIPIEFSPSELTDEQAKAVIAAGIVDRMIKMGLLRVIYDPKRHDKPIFMLTEKGRKFMEK